MGKRREGRGEVCPVWRVTPILVQGCKHILWDLRQDLENTLRPSYSGTLTFAVPYSYAPFSTLPLASHGLPPPRSSRSSRFSRLMYLSSS